MELIVAALIAGAAQAVFMGLKALQYTNVVNNRPRAIILTQIAVDMAFVVIVTGVGVAAMDTITTGGTLLSYLKLGAFGATIGLMGGIGMAVTRQLQEKVHDRQNKADYTETESTERD